MALALGWYASSTTQGQNTTLRPERDATVGTDQAPADTSTRGDGVARAASTPRTPTPTHTTHDVRSKTPGVSTSTDAAASRRSTTGVHTHTRARDDRAHLFPTHAGNLTPDERDGLLDGGRLWAAERAFTTRRSYLDCEDDALRPRLEEAFLRANHISYHADALIEELGPAQEENP
jgi:hypothetical protein